MPRKTNMEWTKDRVIEDAMKCDSYNDWVKKRKSSYYYANKNKWKDEINDLFIKAGKEGNLKQRWTKEEIIQESKKYKKWIDLQNDAPILYKAILRYNLKDQIKPTMQSGKIQKWTKDKILADAKRYPNLKEWRKNSPGAYRIAYKFGIYKECSKHFKRLTQIITKEDVFREAFKYNRKVDFQKNKPYHYAKALREGWLKKCCKHMMSLKESKEFGRPYRWTEKTIMKEIKKMKRWSEIQNKFPGMYEAIIRLNLKDKIKPLLKFGSEQKWTYEKAKKIALKYKTKKQFNKYHAGALRQIYYHGWEKELLAHMKTASEQTTKWTHEKILKAVIECKTRHSLSIKYPGAYNKIKSEKLTNYDHLFEECHLKIEKIEVHPKIKKMMKSNNIKFLYEKRFKLKNKIVIPDFIYITENTVTIIEAKTSGCWASSAFHEIDTQVKNQIKAIKNAYPNYKIKHLLVSEEGRIKSKYANINMSLKELNYYLKYGKFKKLKNRTKISLRQLTIQIRNKFIKKYPQFA